MCMPCTNVMRGVVRATMLRRCWDMLCGAERRGELRAWFMYIWESREEAAIRHLSCVSLLHAICTNCSERFDRKS